MKRKQLWMFALATAMAFGLIASKCRRDSERKRDGGSEEGVPLFEFLGDCDVNSFAGNFEKKFPESLALVSFEYSDAGDYRKTTDEATIRAVFGALSEMVVFGKVGDAGTATYMATIQYIFTLPDGKQIVFGFDGGELIYRERERYRVEGYWSLRDMFMPDFVSGIHEMPSSDFLGMCSRIRQDRPRNALD